jgi:pimeloyl-ACP methyl ester carboxylesterase
MNKVVDSTGRMTVVGQLDTQTEWIEKGRVIITVIHGTWASKAAWTRENSVFCNLIRASLFLPNLYINSFQWSGRNSVSARYKASLALSEELEDNWHRWPDARQLLIAHSHGGTVALSALRNGGLSERVLGLACLSTPFLSARTRPATLVSTFGIRVTPLVAVWVIFTLAFKFPGLKHLVDQHETLKPLVGFCIIGVMGGIWKFTPKVIKAFTDKVIERMQIAELKPEQLFILRAPGDEASAALGAAQILNFIVSKIWNGVGDVLGYTVTNPVVDWLSRCLGSRWFIWVSVVMLASVVCLMAFGPSIIFGVPKANMFGWVMAVYLLSTYVLVVFWGGWLILFSLLAAPLPILLAVIVFPFAPELALASLVLNVSAESTPPGSWTVRLLRLRRNSYLGLMHSIVYQDPVAIALLADWIKGRVMSD